MASGRVGSAICALGPRKPAVRKVRAGYDHLAGALGSALLARVYAMGWARRAKDSRVVQFTEPGEYAFRQLFRSLV